MGLDNRAFSPEKVSDLPPTNEQGGAREAVIHYSVEAFGVSGPNDREGSTALSAFLLELIHKNSDGKEKIIRADEARITSCTNFTTKEELENGMKRIRHDLTEWAEKNLPEVSFLLSAGVYLFLGQPKTFSSDAAICRAVFAERYGKAVSDPNIRYYSEEAFQRWKLRRHLENQFTEALVKRQFEVVFQPQYALKQKKILGAEALIRWKHPKYGLLKPADFVPLFESDRLILQLDFFVLEECCRLMRGWYERFHISVIISVNFSRLHVRTEDFLSRFLQITGRYQIQPSHLCIEWTESAFAGGSDDIASLASQLRRKGFHVAIDDFGTGFSSIDSLLSLPADVIKLDKSLLHFQKGDKRYQFFWNYLLHLTKHLKCTIIAEGIEEKWQAEFLQQVGCHYVQGFLYGKPMHIPSFERLLQ